MRSTRADLHSPFDNIKVSLVCPSHHFAKSLQLFLYHSFIYLAGKFGLSFQIIHIHIYTYVKKYIMKESPKAFQDYACTKSKGDQVVCRYLLFGFYGLRIVSDSI